MTRSVLPNVSVVPTSRDLAIGFRALVEPVLPFISLGLILLAAAQLRDGLSQALAMAGLVLPLLAALSLWLQKAGPCIPVLPLFLLSNLFVYGLSINTFNQVDLPDHLLDIVSLPLIIWPVAITIGWYFYPRSIPFSKAPQIIGSSADSSPTLPHLLIGIGLAVQILLFSGILFDLLGPPAVGLTNPLQTLCAIVTLPGGFIGAYQYSKKSLPQPILYWSMILLFFVQFLSSFLLSSAQTLVFSVLLGLWIGRSRQAVPITLVTILFLAILQPGKALMRERYWGSAVPRPPLHELMFEWVDASNTVMNSPQLSKETQGLDKRLANLAMLIFVRNQQQNGYQELGGASYAVIPEILVPRFLTPNKVRSQEGQVLLNLHYGRQASREATETTYIAWGLLPEAVGNYGPLVGPLIIGFLFGLLIRFVELLGASQNLLSKPGLESLVLALLLLQSYEMVASTLFAAAFQSILLIELVSLYFEKVGR
jgi:hypothetical protein